MKPINRRGSWLTFEQRDPHAKVVTLATSCISTSSESAGHYSTVRSTGKIVGINDSVKASPQTVQDGSGAAQE
jgi:hypothetical protein